MPKIHNVVIPGEDRFAPFALTIRVGDIVTWTNQDTDDHTIVSDDVVNSTGPLAINQLLPAGQSVSLRFCHEGLWVYYCRLHATLNAYGQPISPGPAGGIPGLPMSGVIAILPRKNKHY